MSDSPVLTVVPGSLRCEYAENPLGVEACPPRLSWQVAASARNQAQISYQILVASTPALLADGTGDLWDSGEVRSEDCLFIPYAGTELGSGRRAYWAVRVWGEDGVASPYSAPAWWEMGLLCAADWQAQWIAAQPVTDGLPYAGELTAPPSPLFRKEITVDQPVVSARAYVSGLGYFELYVNGQKAGDHVLDPVFTRYDRRTLYVTHDLTGLIQPGANAIGVMLGNGMYNCHENELWGFHWAPWRDLPKLLLQIHLTFADGSEQVIVTDPSWQASTGPVVFDGLRNGEYYDARQEKTGWTSPGYDASEWPPAVIIPEPGGPLVSQQMPPTRVMQTLEPVAVTEVKPGVFVYDLGQNIAGWAQLRLSGPAGTTVTLKYAEMLNADGDIDQSNISWLVKSGDFQTDRYTLKGSGEEAWEPHFTYHGFRWVQVTGFPGTPTLDNLCGRVVHTGFGSAGEFACSSELLNAIQRCTRWSYVGNFVGIPTDCPHREKNGWTGDALLAAEAGLFNFTPAAALVKWMDDFADAMRPSGQLPGVVPTGPFGYNWGNGPAWDFAYTQIPWYLYQYCGDRRILERHYAGMQRYLDYVQGMATDHLVSFGLGDWCFPNSVGSNEPPTPTLLTSSAFYCANARLVAAIARLLGKPSEAAEYDALADQIRAAINRALYDPATGKYADGGQTAQGCALFLGLAEPEETEKVTDQLVAAIEARGGHLDFGNIGSKCVLNALTAQGRVEAAYALATQTTYPSWGWWIEQGATTLWENWEGNISRNHIFMGDISAWMFKTLAGIKPAEPGFKAFTVHPHVVGDLTWVRAEHQSPYGVIRSAWEKTGEGLTLEVEIPANTVARVYLPAAEAAQITESGKPLAEAEGVTGIIPREGHVAVQVGSGVYRFAVRTAQ
jgi:alpha-L-rhamnosidase